MKKKLFFNVVSSPLLFAFFFLKALVVYVHRLINEVI